jgi:hypothetical protein
LQEAIARIHLARNAALGTLSAHEAVETKTSIAPSNTSWPSKTPPTPLHAWDVEKAAVQTSVESVIFAGKMVYLWLKTYDELIDKAANTALESIPKTTIFGLAVGGDTLSAARGAILANYAIAHEVNGELNFYKEFAVGAFTTSKDAYVRLREATFVGPLMRSLEQRSKVLELDATLGELAPASLHHQSAPPGTGRRGAQLPNPGRPG